MLHSFAGCNRADKVEESAPAKDSGAISLGAEAQKHIGLKVAPAAMVQLTEYLRATGTVQPIDGKVGHVRPFAKGRVQEVLVKVGDRVQSGQALAVFDNIEAGEVVAQYESARAELQRIRIQEAASRKQLERTRRLAEIGAGAQRELEAAETEHRALLEGIKAQESAVEGLAARLRRFGMSDSAPGKTSITTIRAPFPGVVTLAEVSPGEVVDAGMELFSIADIREVWVQAEVYEKDLGRIHVGQLASISVDTYQEKFSGRVAYISDILDPQTRTAKVRCVVPNKQLLLKLDMFASVDVPTTFSRKAIAVPASAIQEMEGGNVVFVRKADERFEAREVKTGNTVEGQTEITSGLAEGEPIVVQGSFHLKSIVLGESLGEEE
jgi:cobalt-zinc-cadmium efflux system membrane fusion protein